MNNIKKLSCSSSSQSKNNILRTVWQDICSRIQVQEASAPPQGGLSSMSPLRQIIQSTCDVDATPDFPHQPENQAILLQTLQLLK